MIRTRLGRIYSFRRTLWDLAIKQLKVRYSGSMLGIWWAIVAPAILAISINFIFTNVFKVATKNFTLFVLSGIMPWLFFSNALSESINSFTDNSSILRQSVFPRELIPISVIVTNFLNFVIGFSVLSAIFVIVKPKVATALPFLLLVLALHFVFLVGIGLLFSSLNVFFRDLSHLMSIALMLWFWITPVFYSYDMLSFPYRWICLFNPMAHYVVAYRRILFEARAPSLPSIFMLFAISLLFFAAGYRFFLKNEAGLLKRI